MKRVGIKGKAFKTIAAFSLAFGTMVASGRDLLWTAYNARTWDLGDTRQNWDDMAYTGTTRTYFQNGDNVLFDEERVPTMDSVTLAATVTPGNLVFNITNAFQVTSSGVNFFGANSIVKNGSGTLTWTFNSGGTSTAATPIQINDGVLVVNSASQNPRGYVPMYGEYTREYIVNNGAELRVAYRNCLGLCLNYTIPTAGGGIVRVKKGGKFSLYIPDKSAHCANSVWDLYMEGGTLDFQAKGPNASTGLLLVNHKLSVSGDTPCVIAGNANFDNAYIAINKNTPTIFDIADVSGDSEPDLTMDIPITHEAGGTPQLVKQGAGTMRMLYKNSFLKSDMVIKEGTVSCDYHNPAVAEFGSNGSTVLGDMTTAGRTITVQDSGRLEFMQRNIFTSYGGGVNGGNGIATELVVKDGGTVFLHGGANLGPLTVADGNIQFAVTNFGWGAISVRGTMKVRGTKPLVMRFQGQLCRQILYREYATVFDVADVTGNAEADFITELPFVMPDYHDYYTDATTGEKYPYGFVKTGAGTMVTTGDSYSGAIAMNGEVRVTEGTFQVDGNIGRSSAVVVSAGAYLAGTGTVNNVQIAAEGGFRATARQTEPLKIRGNLTIGANPVICIDNLDGIAESRIKAQLFTAAGTVTGAENLNDATVYLDNAVWNRGKYKIEYANGTLTVKGVKGTRLVIR